MKNITRLSLAFMIFSFFSISYLVTEVSALDCADPTNATMPECAHGGMPPMGSHGGMPSGLDCADPTNATMPECAHGGMPPMGSHGAMQSGNSSSNDSRCASNERYSERDHYCVPK